MVWGDGWLSWVRTHYWVSHGHRVPLYQQDSSSRWDLGNFSRQGKIPGSPLNLSRTRLGRLRTRKRPEEPHLGFWAGRDLGRAAGRWPGLRIEWSIPASWCHLPQIQRPKQKHLVGQIAMKMKAGWGQNHSATDQQGSSGYKLNFI